MVTTEIKNKIVAAITANRANYPSDAKHAASLGITAAVYSGVKNGQTERMLSDANWISIARKLGVSLRGEIKKGRQYLVIVVAEFQGELCGAFLQRIAAHTHRGIARIGGLRGGKTAREQDENGEHNE